MALGLWTDAESYYVLPSGHVSVSLKAAIVVYSSPVAKNKIVEDSLWSALFVAHDLLNTGTCRWCLEVRTRHPWWLPAVVRDVKSYNTGDRWCLSSFKSKEQCSV
jgi:hypothetical protein